MKTIALIAVRLGSSRLPNKAMMPILGKPMIEHMVDRIRCAQSIDDILIATTILESDDPLESFAKKIGVECFRGAVDDVLGRMTAAVEDSGTDLVVEMLGDNPLVHSDLIDDVVAFYLEKQVDYAANVTVEYPHAGQEYAKFPVGIRVQVFTPQVLAKCNQLVVKAEHREHSTSHIYENPSVYSLAYFEAKEKWADLRHPDLTFAVNYQQNFDLIEKIFENNYSQDDNFSLHKVIQMIEEQPVLQALMGPPHG